MRRAAPVAVSGLLSSLRLAPLASRPVLRWVVGALAALAAMALRAVATPLLGDTVPFVFAYPAVVFVALGVGAGPALLTALLCCGWALSPAVPPKLSAEWPLQTAAFLLSAAAVVMVCSAVAPPRRPTAPTPDSPAVRWLRAAMLGAALLPAAFFGAVAWWGHREARLQAEADLQRTSRIAAEHARFALRMADTMADRVLGLTSGLTDEELASRQPVLNDRFADLAFGLDAIDRIWLFDAEGRVLLSSRSLRDVPQVSVADRDYFVHHRTHREGGPYLAGPMEGRLVPGTFVALSRRRDDMAGQFAGVVNIGLRPAYFAEFYRALSHESAAISSLSLVRQDGSVLAQWPARREPVDLAPLREAGASASGALRLWKRPAAAASGTVGGVPPAGEEFVAALPVGRFGLTVVASMPEQRVLGAWQRSVSVLAALVFPTALGLVYVSWVALRRTQREHTALNALREQHRRREQAEAALLEAQKLEAVAQLTGGVAHDFNNLLMVVSNNTHVLKRLHPQAGASKQVAGIERAVSSGVKLTRQLLSFSRRQAVRPEIVRLQDWLPASADLIRTSLGAVVQIEVQVAPDTAAVRVDVPEFELALLNLAVNARDAMPQGGRLSIDARNAPAPQGGAAMVVVTVRDTGVGIPAELLDKVFEPFFTTKGPAKGTGLGLSQVYGFCAQAGGQARIESRVGQGTAVSMWLPSSLQAPAPVPARPRPREEQEQLAGRLLLVEDNEDVASANEPLLTAFGLTVVRAENADAAMRRLRRGEAFDLVLSDIVMPGELDGISLATAVRERWPGLPVLLMTGYAAQVQKAIAEGFAVLQKPCDPDRLFDAIDAALRGREHSGPVPLM